MASKRKAGLGQQPANGREVEQTGQQLGVVDHRVDDVDLHARHRGRSQLAQVDVGACDGEDPREGLRVAVDRLGDAFGRRPAVAGVVFDAEVAVRPARVVAGRQDDAAEGLALADHATRRRRRQDAVLPHQHAAEAVGRRHAHDGLDGHIVVEPAVTAQHERLALESFERVEDGLDEVLQVMRLLEDGDLLAKARGSWALARNGLGGDSHHIHESSLSLFRWRGGVCRWGQ
jgi:hypothetical protein